MALFLSFVMLFSTIFGTTIFAQSGQGIITISLNVTGDAKNEMIIENYTTQLAENATVEALLRKAFDAESIPYEPSGEGDTFYLIDIAGLGYGTNGPNSGWEYNVNGEHAMIGAGNYILHDGDTVNWVYTDDYTIGHGYRMDADQLDYDEDEPNETRPFFMFSVTETPRHNTKKIYADIDTIINMFDDETITACMAKEFTPNHYVEDFADIDELYKFRNEDGKFSYTIGGTSSNDATLQALHALIAYTNYYAQQGYPKPLAHFVPNDFDHASDWAKSSIETYLNSPLIDSKRGFDKLNPQEVIGLDEFTFMYATALSPDIAASIGTSERGNIINRSTMASLLYEAVNPSYYEEISAAALPADFDCVTFRIQKVKEAGIMQGVSKNDFDPDGAVTREMAITAIMNTYKIMNP